MIQNRYKALYLVVILLFVFSMGNVYAADHRLESLDINVFINSDGSATIQEHRVANLVEGTESYIVIDNVGISQIKDFAVRENGNLFQNDDNWDINASREYKKGKSGIIRTSSGYELSWGVGDYGHHEYDLEYTITNFVEQLDDSQMVFWRFVNPDTNIPPERVTVTIGSSNEFSEENEKIWGFGFAGDVRFQDGKVVATSSRPLSRNDNVTLLLKLPDGMFATDKSRNASFQDIQDEAFVGSDYDQGVQEDGGFTGERPTKINPIVRIFQTLTRLGGGLIFFIVVFVMGKTSKSTNKSPNKFTRHFKEEYYRDYPYEGNFLDIYYIPYMMGTANFENLLTGFILKWINEDRIIAVEEEVGWVFKKDSTNLKFLNTSQLDHILENELFQMMLTAAGSNEILEEKEFTKWARSNYTKIDRWEKAVNEYSKKRLENLGYLEVTEKKVLFFTFPDYQLTAAGKKVEENIYKYINYLNDFSLLNEHEAVNVRIWDNIMIWAGFLGLTAVVVKQFEKLYPNYTQETVYRGNTIYLTSHLASNISHTKAQAARSSGSGGSTSMGGGGGFSGGGSGGGTR